MAKPEVTEREQPRPRTRPTPTENTLTVNPEQAPPQEPNNDSAVQPNDGPRTTHPPAGQAVKKDPDGSGRDVYPADRPDVYGGPRPTDADGRRDREEK